LGFIGRYWWAHFYFPALPQVELKLFLPPHTTLKGLNVNSPRFHLGLFFSPGGTWGKMFRDAPTLKGLNVNSPRWNLGKKIIKHAHRWIVCVAIAEHVKNINTTLSMSEALGHDIALMRIE